MESNEWQPLMSSESQSQAAAHSLWSDIYTNHNKNSANANYNTIIKILFII